MYVACTQFQCEKRDVCRGYVALFISLVISCYLALLRFMFACVTFIHLCEFVWGLTSDRFSASAFVSCSSSFHIQYVCVCVCVCLSAFVTCTRTCMYIYKLLYAMFIQLLNFLLSLECCSVVLKVVRLSVQHYQ